MTKNIANIHVKWQVCLTAVLLFLLSGVCYAQPSPATSKKEKELIRNAESEWNQGHLGRSFTLYKEAVALNPQNRNTNYQVGEIYFLSDSAQIKALPYLRNAIKYSPAIANDTDIYAYYYLAYCYMLNEQYDSAAFCFKKYEAHLTDSKVNKDAMTEINRNLQICAMAPGILKRDSDSTVYFITGRPLPQKLRTVVRNMGDSINTRYPEYAQILFDSDRNIIFTSRRPTLNEKKVDFNTGKYLENIFYSSKGSGGNWSKPVLYNQKVNLPPLKRYTATVTMSANKNILFTYQSGNILESKKKHGKWGAPEQLSNDIAELKKWFVPSVFLSNDGKILLLVSDVAGGQGGKDIYICTADKRGKWSAPKNLGPVINTSEDEDAPFLMPDNKTLFFSSKGHGGLGGYDIFVSHYDSATGAWSTPQNLGAPINSPGDDIYFTYNDSAGKGYLSSSRPGGYGDMDIYSFSLESTVPPPPKIIAKDTTAKVARVIPHLPSCTVYFELAKSRIDAKYYPALDSIVAIMKAYPEIKINVNGYTDVIGGETYNKQLSLLRASAVADYLYRHGVKFNQVIYQGLGDTHSVAPNDGIHNYLNRRAELLQILK